MFSLASSISSCSNSLLNAFKTSACALSATFITPVRYRFHEDKPAILRRRWGYKDKASMRGTLPRVPSSYGLPVPPYVPKNAWSERKALFGQNDYIDILGDDETISPTKFAYGVPAWLRGFNGSEYQMLLRKQSFFGRQLASSPLGSHFVKKRLKHLYRRINYKTLSYLDKKVMRR